MFELNLKKLDKNLVGNIVIFVSILLVLACFALLMISQPFSVEEVEWDGYIYYIYSDMEYVMDNDTFNISSPAYEHNINLKKTTDQTNFNKYIGSDVSDSVYSTRNSTHIFFLNEGAKYGFIVPKDSYETTFPGSGLNGYELKGNPVIIEINGTDASEISNLIYSSYR